MIQYELNACYLETNPESKLCYRCGRDGSSLQHSHRGFFLSICTQGGLRSHLYLYCPTLSLAKQRHGCKLSAKQIRPSVTSGRDCGLARVRSNIDVPVMCRPACACVCVMDAGDRRVCTALHVSCGLTPVSPEGLGEEGSRGSEVN